MKASFSALAAVLLLCAACAAPPAPDAASPPPALGASFDATACAATGGTARPVCRMQRLMCVKPYADAGKACTDDSQCAGGCLYDGAPVAPDGTTMGLCREDDDPCGCVEHVVNGKKAGGLCVD